MAMNGLLIKRLRSRHLTIKCENNDKRDDPRLSQIILAACNKKGCSPERKQPFFKGGRLVTRILRQSRLYFHCIFMERPQVIVRLERAVFDL